MPGLLYEGGENGRPRRSDRARPGCLPCAWGGYKTITKSVKEIEAERTNGPPKAHAWRVPAPGGGEREGVGRSPARSKAEMHAADPQTERGVSGTLTLRGVRNAASGEWRPQRRAKEKGPRRGPAGYLPPGTPNYTTSRGKSQSPKKSRGGGDALNAGEGPPPCGAGRDRASPRGGGADPAPQNSGEGGPRNERRRAEAGAQTRKGDPPRGSPQTGGALAADRKRGRRAQARPPARPAGRALGGPPRQFISMRGAEESPPGAVTRRGEAPRRGGPTKRRRGAARPSRGPWAGPNTATSPGAPAPWRNKGRAATSGGPSPARADDGRADQRRPCADPAPYLLLRRSGGPLVGPSTARRREDPPAGLPPRPAGQGGPGAKSPLAGTVSQGRRARRPVGRGWLVGTRGQIGPPPQSEAEGPPNERSGERRELGGSRKKNGAPEGAPTQFLAPGRDHISRRRISPSARETEQRT